MMRFNKTAHFWKALLFLSVSSKTKLAASVKQRHEQQKREDQWFPTTIIDGRV